ncbi:hypothetical protein [Empedobacter falsenii]|uniref:Uncharacterized protein n=1 Tax=Empedobacter falsenii TaxID=343874 RepID=A0A3R8STT0_9FLAO|nr:hypothetical protein [Empedobacter falsenii]RRT94168.1 hypothetical protein EGI89_02035 [Empedobacter falsenii]RRT94362.1 hypothetical protein EGI88_02040 [Empedobacter falsenii]
MKNSVDTPQAKNVTKIEKTPKIVTLEEKQKAKEQINLLLENNPSPDKRISNLKILNKLGEKVEFLRRKNEEFSLFVASMESTANKITIQNSQGFEFSLNNSETLSKVIEVIEKDLDQVTKKAETEFLNFNI